MESDGFGGRHGGGGPGLVSLKVLITRMVFSLLSTSHSTFRFQAVILVPTRNTI